MITPCVFCPNEPNSQYLLKWHLSNITSATCVYTWPELTLPFVQSIAPIRREQCSPMIKRWLRGENINYSVINDIQKIVILSQWIIWLSTGVPLSFIQKLSEFSFSQGSSHFKSISSADERSISEWNYHLAGFNSWDTEHEGIGLLGLGWQLL